MLLWKNNQRHGGVMWPYAIFLCFISPTLHQFAKEFKRKQMQIKDHVNCFLK